MMHPLFKHSAPLSARFFAGLLAGAFLLAAPNAVAQGQKPETGLMVWPSFTKFQTTVQGSSLMLTWSVDQAYEAEYFDVLLNTGGGEFSSIGRVAAKAATTAYGFRVLNFQKNRGKVYYQIRLTTQKDSAIYSPVRAYTTSGAAPAKPVPGQTFSSTTP